MHTDQKLEQISEENYFFKFSKYQKELLEYVKKDEHFASKQQQAEAIIFVENGLEDFSISREKKRLSWGIPVPDDDTQVMYVWFDALTNYISTLGWPADETNWEIFKKFWEDGETFQVAGKGPSALPVAYVAGDADVCKN